MEMVADAGKLVSMDIVEINPVLDSMNRTADLCVGLVTSAFGLQDPLADYNPYTAVSPIILGAPGFRSSTSV